MLDIQIPFLNSSHCMPFWKSENNGIHVTYTSISRMTTTQISGRNIRSIIQCSKAVCLGRISQDGCSGDFHLYSRAYFSVLAEADAIFYWEIKEGRCKWVKERQNAEKPPFFFFFTSCFLRFHLTSTLTCMGAILTKHEKIKGTNKKKCDANHLRTKRAWSWV